MAAVRGCHRRTHYPTVTLPLETLGPSVPSVCAGLLHGRYPSFLCVGRIMAAASRSFIVCNVREGQSLHPRYQYNRQIRANLKVDANIAEFVSRYGCGSVGMSLDKSPSTPPLQRVGVGPVTSMCLPAIGAIGAITTRRGFPTVWPESSRYPPINQLALGGAIGRGLEGVLGALRAFEQSTELECGLASRGHYNARAMSGYCGGNVGNVGGRNAGGCWLPAPGRP